MRSKYISQFGVVFFSLVLIYLTESSISSLSIEISHADRNVGVTSRCETPGPLGAGNGAAV